MGFFPFPLEDTPEEEYDSDCSCSTTDNESPPPNESPPKETTAAPVNPITPTPITGILLHINSMLYCMHVSKRRTQIPHCKLDEKCC